MTSQISASYTPPLPRDPSTPASPKSEPIAGHLSADDSVVYRREEYEPPRELAFVDPGPKAGGPPKAEAPPRGGGSGGCSSFAVRVGCVGGGAVLAIVGGGAIAPLVHLWAGVGLVGAGTVMVIFGLVWAEYKDR